MPSPPRPVGAFLLDLLFSGLTFLTVGCWALVQFRWVQLQFPALAALSERLLMLATPTVAAVRWTELLVMAAGVAASPFYLAPLLCWLYHQFMRPLPPSFIALVGWQRGAWIGLE